MIEETTSSPPNEVGASEAEKDTFNSPNESSASQMERGISNTSDDSSSLHKDENAISSPPTMTFTQILALISLAACFTGAHIASLLVGPGINFIADGLHIGSERSWIVVAGTLATAIVAPCVGYIQDLVGRRVSLAIGLLLVIVGDILSGTANGFDQIVTGSVFKGFGSGILELTSIAAVAELVPANKRGFFLALNVVLTAAFVPAVLYAQLIGSDWRWLFWVSLIWNVAATVGISLSYFRVRIDSMNRPKEPITLKQFDWVGTVLLTIGLTIFLVGLQSGGRAHPWDSVYVLCLLIFGIATIGIFIFWESRNIGRPLVPFRLFSGQRVVVLAIAIGSLGGINYATILNLGPTIIQTSFRETNVGYGLLALGPGLGLVVGAITANVSISIFKPYCREIITAAAVIMTAFQGSNASVNPNISTTFAILSSFAGFGIGALVFPLTTLATLACPEDLIGTTVALLITIRSVGGSIGYTILDNIFLTRSKSTIPSQMAPRLAAAGVPRSKIEPFIKEFTRAISEGNLSEIPKVSPKVLAAAHEGFAWGTSEAAQTVYYALIGFGAAAVILSLTLPNMKRYMTDKVLVRMH